MGFFCCELARAAPARLRAVPPDIHVALKTESRIVDLKRQPIDLAMRHGLGNYLGPCRIYARHTSLVDSANEGKRQRGKGAG
jgi:hypothetical protein